MKNDIKDEVAARLAAIGAEQEERLAKRRSAALRLPYINLVTFPMNSDVLGLVPKEEAAEANAVLFYKKGKDVRVGVVNPNTESFDALREKVKETVGVEPQVYVISNHSLQVALSRYIKSSFVEKIRGSKMIISKERLHEFEDAIANLEKMGKHITEMPPSEVLTAIVVGAIQMGASDLHIGPRNKMVRLRYRIDGVLQDVVKFDKSGWQQILSRVKVLAKLKINVHTTPQEGSFILDVDGELYDARVSILPGAFGENIVIRMFSRQEAEALDLRALGMKDRDYKVVTEALKESTGLILAAGPTGSGKTTTIAAAMNLINSPELKMITLEDPVEYRIKGVEQTQVDTDSGYTFAVGLRSILRQDPDVIFVGEIRDVETAETSIHAAMTGHLVFSTIHANDAPGVILRVVSIGVKPYVLAPALNLVISQRLVRVVCKECAEEYEVSQNVREHIRDVMEGVKSEIFDPAVLDKRDLKFVKARGCEECSETGYKGRIGVFEVFAVEGEIEELILQGVDSIKLTDAALRSGMTTIAQDAYLKVIDRITTVDEVKRVSSE